MFLHVILKKPPSEKMLFRLTICYLTISLRRLRCSMNSLSQSSLSGISLHISQVPETPGGIWRSIVPPTLTKVLESPNETEWRYRGHKKMHPRILKKSNHATWYLKIHISQLEKGNIWERKCAKKEDLEKKGKAALPHFLLGGNRKGNPKEQTTERGTEENLGRYFLDKS